MRKSKRHSNKLKQFTHGKFINHMSDQRTESLFQTIQEFIDAADRKVLLANPIIIQSYATCVVSSLLTGAGIVERTNVKFDHLPRLQRKAKKMHGALLSGLRIHFQNGHSVIFNLVDIQTPRL